MASSYICQCPFCGTTFRASGAQLQCARGTVRCGACLGVFDARRHHLQHVAIRQRHDNDHMPVTLDMLEPDEVDAPLTAETGYLAEAELQPLSDAEAEVHTPTAPSSGRYQRHQTLAIAAAMAVLIVLGLSLTNWQASPVARLASAAVCQHLNCPESWDTTPPLYLNRLALSFVPGNSKQLLLKATLFNSGSNALSLPAIHATLFAADGSQLQQQLAPPDTYLPAGLKADTLGAGEQLPISIVVERPLQAISSFEMGVAVN